MIIIKSYQSLMIINIYSILEDSKLKNDKFNIEWS